VFLFFIFLSSTITENKKIPGSSFVVDSVIVVQQTIMFPINFVKNKIYEFGQLQSFYAEYQILKSNLDDFALIQARNFQLEQENQELRGLLNIENSLLDYETLPATVLFRDIDLWQNELTINVGSIHGVDVGMAVIVSDGLIGKIISVDSMVSVVQLITTTTNDNKVSVVIDVNGNRVNGVIQKFDTDRKSFELIGIETEVEPGIGDQVLTGGIGGVYPSGIPVGEVVNVGQDEFSYYQIVQIESKVDFNNIHYVTVLRKEQTDDN